MTRVVGELRRNCAAPATLKVSRDWYPARELGVEQGERTEWMYGVAGGKKRESRVLESECVSETQNRQYYRW
jgi:hypothetical protein